MCRKLLFSSLISCEINNYLNVEASSNRIEARRHRFSIHLHNYRMPDQKKSKKNGDRLIPAVSFLIAPPRTRGFLIASHPPGKKGDGLAYSLCEKHRAHPFSFCVFSPAIFSRHIFFGGRQVACAPRLSRRRRRAELHANTLHSRG